MSRQLSNLLTSYFIYLEYKLKTKKEKENFSTNLNDLTLGIRIIDIKTLMNVTCLKNNAYSLEGLIFHQILKLKIFVRSINETENEHENSIINAAIYM